MLSIKGFIQKYIGTVADVPWGYAGECVSLVQRYLNEVYGLKLVARGNAIDYGNRIIKDGDGYEVSASEARYGDLVVWGGFGGLGHIGVYMGGGNVFDQSNYERKTAQIRPLLANPKQYIRLYGTPKADETPAPVKKSNDEIANEVINGDWGNGADRTKRLTDAGYDASAIQVIVNSKLEPAPTPKPTLKPVGVVADEVINGDWGNGQARKDALTKAGYNYDEVQAEVNRKGQATAPKPTPIKAGDRVTVLNPINYDNGKKFVLYHKVYDVIQVSGNRAVIGIGSSVTSAINVNNLKKV